MLVLKICKVEPLRSHHIHQNENMMGQKVYLLFYSGQLASLLSSSYSYSWHCLQFYCNNQFFSLVSNLFTRERAQRCFILIWCCPVPVSIAFYDAIENAWMLHAKRLKWAGLWVMFRADTNQQRKSVR